MQELNFEQVEEVSGGGVKNVITAVARVAAKVPHPVVKVAGLVALGAVAVVAGYENNAD
ncbi:hypothetical protein [Arsukibacterium perlucidum]|uniref:hypothetical protein n=1 Tax=Arsukibacterium perlucidum TaxID=368811 RepID=UPI00037190E5|nr:hypothetical protein [Arsukibacterium perlucidum]